MLWPISTGHALRLLRIDSATPLLISRPNLVWHSDRLLTTAYESSLRTSLWRELCSGYRSKGSDSEEGVWYVGMVRTGDRYGLDVDLPISFFPLHDGHVLVARLSATLGWSGPFP